MKATKTTDKVQAGAKFLTETYGEGWKTRINLDTLRLNDPKQCILGQTDTDYFSHADQLKLTSPQATSLGFDVDSDSAIALEDQYDALTEAWKDYLKK